jgi:hypothetical protein
VIVVAILAACSAGDDAPSSADDGRTSPDRDTRSEFSDGSEPWLVDLTDPTGPLLDTWVDRAVIGPTPTDPPLGIESQLTWIYEDLIELWRTDPHLAALGMGDAALDPTHAELTPSAATDIIGAASLMLADSYAVIAASSELAAKAGGPGEPMFTAWSQFAGYWVTAAENSRDATVVARDLDPADQSCYLATIGGGVECEGPGADLGIQVIIDVDEQYQAIDAVELDAPGTYAVAESDFDECRAWEQAVEVTGLTADDELRIWIAIDGSDLDVFFVGLSGCARAAERTEDPETDGVADLAAYEMYLASVAEAIIETGYDGSVAEMADGAEDERRSFESTSAEATGQIVSAARDSASLLWSDAFNSELTAKLYMITGIEIDDWAELVGIDLDWFDLGNTICDEWATLILPYPSDQTAAIDAAVDDLGLAGSVIPEACG